MDGQAKLSIAAEGRDPGMIAARSAGIWIGLALDDDALARRRRPAARQFKTRAKARAEAFRAF